MKELLFLLSFLLFTACSKKETSATISLTPKSFNVENSEFSVRVSYPEITGSSTFISAIKDSIESLVTKITLPYNSSNIDQTRNEIRKIHKMSSSKAQYQLRSTYEKIHIGQLIQQNLIRKNWLEQIY